MSTTVKTKITQIRKTLLILVRFLFFRGIELFLIVISLAQLHKLSYVMGVIFLGISGLLGLRVLMKTRTLYKHFKG